MTQSSDNPADHRDAPSSSVWRGASYLNDHLAGSPLSRLEEIEMLTLGVTGKLSLWRALQHSVAGERGLCLEARAVDREGRISAATT